MSQIGTMIEAAEARYRTALATFDAERFAPLDEADMARARAMTPGERVAFVGELTRRAWARTGAPWPGGPRAQWPVRRLRLADDT